MMQQLQPRRQDPEQVLEVVLARTTDLQLLHLCVTLSTRCCSIILSNVRSNVPNLLKTWTQTSGAAQKEHWWWHGDRSLWWLCHIAGPAAMAAPDVAEVVLLNLDAIHHQAMEFLVRAGIQLSDKLLYEASRQRVCNISSLVMELKRASPVVPDGLPSSGLSHLYNGLFVEPSRTNDEAAKGVCAMLANAPVAEAPRLLTVLANLSAHHAAFDQLLQRYLVHVGLRHAQPHTSSGMMEPAPADTCPMSGSSSSSASGCALKASREQRQQRVPDKQQQHLGEFLVELLTTAIIRSDTVMVSGLAEVVASLPGSQAPGSRDVLKLLHLAVLKMPSGKYVHNKPPASPLPQPCFLGTLVQLPAAQHITADAIVSLVQLGLNMQRPWHLGPLMSLPGARGIPAKQLHNLILQAMKSKASKLVEHLSRLAADTGSSMEPDDAMSIMEFALKNPCCFVSDKWGAPGDGIAKAFQMLKPLGLGRLLAADNRLLKLLQLALKLDSQSCDPAIDLLLQLKPAAEQITDIDGNAAFLKAIIKKDMDPEGIELLPATRELSTAAVAELLHCSIYEYFTPGFISQMPAAQQLPVEDVRKLLSRCVANGMEFRTASLIPYLCSLPAAAELSADFIAQMLQHMLEDAAEIIQSEIPHDALDSILALPAAKLISTAAARELLLAAQHAGWVWLAAKLREQLPQLTGIADDLDCKQLVQLLEQRLTDGDDKAVAELLSHSATCNISPAALVGLLSAAFQACARHPHKYHVIQALDRAASVLLELPAAKKLEAAAVRQLLLTNFNNVQSEFAEVLLALPAAQQFSEDDIEELLCCFVDLWSKLCQDPRFRSRVLDTLLTLAEALEAAALARVILKAIEASSLDAPYNIPQLLLELPAAKDLDVVAVGDLLAACVKKGLHVEVAVALASLPAVASLSAECITPLLQVCVETQQGPVFQQLLKLPSAPRDDAQVQMYAEIMQWCQPLCDSGRRECERRLKEPNNWCTCPKCIESPAEA